MGDVAQLAALEEEATIRAVPRNMTLPFAAIALDRSADIGNFIVKVEISNHAIF